MIDLLLDGLSNLNIAMRLGLEEDTVKKHLTNIFAKKEVCSRLDLAVTVLRERQAEEVARLKQEHEAELQLLRGEFASAPEVLRREFALALSGKESQNAA